MIFDSDVNLSNELAISETGKNSLASEIATISGVETTRITGEFRTAGQRQASSIHEVSYRACFKPQLPSYFIKRFTAIGDWVYDPFSGRGTTAIEAALQGRCVVANDVNPLSAILAKPRLNVPTFSEISDRLSRIEFDLSLHADIDLSMFYEKKTEAEITSLKKYLSEKKESGTEDAADEWIRMVATNRLTGHSPGFFSVYTFPPNQAVSPESQIKINNLRGQSPTYKDTKAIILKKSRQLLKGLSQTDQEFLKKAALSAKFITGSADKTSSIEDESVSLTVTSPPFLDIVQYAEDNWLRCWFNSLDTNVISKTITMSKTVDGWSSTMQKVFTELFRITKPGGIVAFEVGEIRNGKIKLEESVVPIAVGSGFSCQAVLINSQKFSKTSNLWGVTNNKSGTNTNRIVVLVK